MSAQDQIYYGVEIVRGDGTAFLAVCGERGVMPALFRTLSSARKFRTELNAHDLKTRAPIRLRVRIEPR